MVNGVPKKRKIIDNARDQVFANHNTITVTNREEKMRGC